MKTINNKASLLTLLLIYLLLIGDNMGYAQTNYRSIDGLHTAVAQTDGENLHISVNGGSALTLPFSQEIENVGFAYDTEKYGAVVAYTGYSIVFVDRRYNPVFTTIFQKTQAIPLPNPNPNTKKRTMCRSCKGTGVCGVCKGTGYFRGYEGEPIKCTHCSVTENYKCRICNGTGYW